GCEWPRTETAPRRPRAPHKSNNQASSRTSFGDSQHRPAPHHQRQIHDVGHFDHLSGLEGFGAARLPALTMGEDVAFALGPVEDFSGQAAHGLCAEAYGASWARRSEPRTTRISPMKIAAV